MAVAYAKRAQLYSVLVVIVMSLCLGAPDKQRKIFFIGMNKTGTKLLCELTTLMGLPSCHEAAWARAANNTNFSYFRNNECRAFCEGERPALEWVERTFPGSAYVLNTRPLESWLVSRQAFFRLMWARHDSSLPMKDVVRKHRTSAEDVHRWIVEREGHHAYVLQYFLSNLNSSKDASTSATVAAALKGQPGPVMATTGTVYRRVNPNDPGGPPSFFMMVDTSRDGDAKVKEQLTKLLAESGIEHDEVPAKNPGVVGAEQFPTNTARAKKCVSDILQQIALTPEERAADLLIGRPVLPLPDDYDGSSCDYSPVTKKKRRGFKLM